MPELPAVSRLKDIHWRKFLSIFPALAFALVAMFAILLASQAWKTMHHNLHVLMHEEQNHITMAESLFHQELGRLSRELLTFTGTPGILHFFANPSDKAARQTLTTGLSNIKYREDYDQARILDINGRELVRVGSKDRQTMIIPIQEPENKVPETFVKKVLQLQVRGRIAISAIELTRNQNGEITQPFHPIFHLGTPIFNQYNHKVGVLLLTYRGQQILDLFTEATAQHHDLEGELTSNNPQILNQEGYWLLAPDKEDEWGFVRDQERRFDRRFPGIWQTMRNQGQGQIQTAEGLFTFTTLPLVVDRRRARDAGSAHATALSSEEDQDATPFWLLVYQVFPEELDHLNADTRRFHLTFFVVIIVGFLPLLWSTALLLKKKQEDKAQIQAEKNRITHLNILLQTIIQIHRLIDQEKKKQGLVQGCCEILVTNRGYASAWIIILDQAGKVDISAASGLLLNFDQLKQQINMGNPPPCIRECSRQQGLTIVDQPAIFCAECPMANEYPRTGVMCAALTHDANVYGYLNVLLPLDFTQDQEGENRFREIAKDIGYALYNLELQEKKLRTESSLRASEERLRGITDSAQDAILMMDTQGAISYWNPSAETIFGYPTEEAIGKKLYKLLAPSRYQTAHHSDFPELVRTHCSNAVGKTVELSALHKDGREIPVTLSLSAIFYDENWHTVGILRDMSNYKLMEERMLQSEKMTTIAGLAAGVAHEINTPLSAILQSIQVIRQSLDPELAGNQEVASRCGLDLAKVHDYFTKREIIFFMDGIRDSAVKSGKIISNLLQFSRPQNMEFAREDLALLLDKAVELARNDYNLKKSYDILNVEIDREYTPNLPPVSCLAMDIEQVFINLLKNAVQAMGDRPGPKFKSRITLRTLHLNEIVRVEIADNGPGMDEETRRHIFDPFFTTKDIGVGTGLGLTVSYAIIVTKHGGQLTVQSAPGQGVTFTIDLPLNNERQQQ